MTMASSFCQGQATFWVMRQVRSMWTLRAAMLIAAKIACLVVPTTRVNPRRSPLRVPDAVGVKVEIREAGKHLVEQVGLCESVDLGIELELVDYLSSAGREVPEVAAKDGGDVVRVVREATEVEPGCVVELVARDGTECTLWVRYSTFEFGRTGCDRVSGLFKY